MPWKTLPKFLNNKWVSILQNLLQLNEKSSHLDQISYLTFDFKISNVSKMSQKSPKI